MLIAFVNSSHCSQQLLKTLQRVHKRRDTITNTINQRAQLNYDLGSLKNDAKEIAYIKQQADAAPNKQISVELAQQLHTAQQNYATNLQGLTVDINQMNPSLMSPQEFAQTGSLIDSLTHGVQDTTLSLESNNNLDQTLQQMGDSAGNLHSRMDQVTTNNGYVQYAAQTQAHGATADTAAAGQEAQSLVAGINAQSTEPYAEGHTAAPQDGYDVYDPAIPANSVDNPASQLGPIGGNRVTNALASCAAQDGQPAPAEGWK